MKWEGQFQRSLNAQCYSPIILLNSYLHFICINLFASNGTFSFLCLIFSSDAIVKYQIKSNLKEKGFILDCITVHQNGEVKTTGQLVNSYPQSEAEHHGCKQTAKLTFLTFRSVCDWALHCYLFLVFSLLVSFWISSVQINVSDEDWELQQSICKDFTYNLYVFSMQFDIYQNNSRFITGAYYFQSYTIRHVVLPVKQILNLIRNYFHSIHATIAIIGINCQASHYCGSYD